MTTATDATTPTSAKHAAAAEALTEWVNAAVREVNAYLKCGTDDAKSAWKAGLSERMEPSQRAALTTREDFGIEKDVVIDFSGSDVLHSLERFNGRDETQGIFDNVISHAFSAQHAAAAKALTAWVIAAATNTANTAEFRSIALATHKCYGLERNIAVDLSGIPEFATLERLKGYNKRSESLDEVLGYARLANITHVKNTAVKYMPRHRSNAHKGPSNCR